MIYDLSNALQAEQYKLRCNALFKKKAIVELTEKKPRRTIKQNSYLHLILSYFASQSGNTMEYVKQQYFKRLCNKEIFLKEIDDEHLGRIQIVRSSRDLTTEELSTAIERFRNWSAQTADIYIPSANETDLITLMEQEVERTKQYI